MISISRSLARQFRAVARRAGLSARQAHYVRLVATPEALSLYAANGRVAVEYRDSGRFVAADLTVPLQLFADCEGKSDDLVSIRLGQPGHLVATWDEGGISQHRDYLMADAAAIPVLPPTPREFTDNEPQLLSALRDAMETTDKNQTRYALDCVQLKGNGTLSATDAHQLLMQTGFRFGWTEAVLMEASEVFASRELPNDQIVHIGQTADWVTVQVGAWTLHHVIHKQGRFPDVAQIIPANSAVTTRMQLDPADIEFVSDRIERLPADEEAERPVTIDLNGSVAIRAQQDAESPMTELVLSRSRRTGPELRFQTNREFLVRALDLGFTEVGFVSAESPCVCTDGRRTLVWQPLDSKSALAAVEGIQRIESLSVTSPASAGTTRKAVRPAPIPATGTTVNRVASQLPQPARTGVASKTTRAAQVDASGGVSPSEPNPADVIAQALVLRDQLRQVTQGLTDLAVKIRHQRKQSRLMKSTLQSLQQLKLLEA